MTTWDLRAFGRAFAATLIGLVVVWLVTAASDEGQLTVATRAGRTLPLAPLCSAVGAVVALATARVRSETRALEALGRAPGENALAAAAGAALPSLVVAALIMASGALDVSGFYPRPMRGDDFEFDRSSRTFVSASLAVRVDADGKTSPAAGLAPVDDGLPLGARRWAALATGLAGAALPLVAARATVRPSLSTRGLRRRRRLVAAVGVFGCLLVTLVAFQAAAAHMMSAAFVAAPPLALLIAALFGYRARRGASHVQ